MVAAAVGAAASLATAAGSVAGAVGGSQKSGGSSGSTTSDNTPWGVQAPYLEQGFDRAQTNLRDAMGVQAPTQFVAGENGRQQGANDLLFKQGISNAQQYAGWEGAGQMGAAQMSPYFSQAGFTASNGIGNQSADTGILSNYAHTGSLPGQVSQVDPSLASGITAAGQTGLGSVGAGQNLASAAGMKALDPNGTMNAAVSGAGALSANPYLDAQIDAANRDVSRGLAENDLPGIRAAAMQSGNANSSREGALEAIATRGTGDRMADTAAALRGAAYSQGATLGATGYNTGLSTAVGAGSALNQNASVAGGLLTNEQAQQQQARQFDTTAQLGAANNAATQNLGFQTNDTAARIAGTGQLGTGIGLGQTATKLAGDGTINSLLASYTAGTQEQTGAQAAINDNLAAYRQQTQGNSDLLDRYWSVVGGNKGSSTAGTTATQPNNGGLGGALSGAVGGGMAGYGLYKNLSGTFGTSGGYDPSNYGFTSGVNPNGTLTQGGQALQDLGFFQPLPQ